MADGIKLAGGDTVAADLTEPGLENFHSSALQPKNFFGTNIYASLAEGAFFPIHRNLNGGFYRHKITSVKYRCHLLLQDPDHIL